MELTSARKADDSQTSDGHKRVKMLLLCGVRIPSLPFADASDF